MVATRSVPVSAAISGEDSPDASACDPRAWWNRLEAWVGIAVVAGCCLFVLWQLQPHLLLRNTTPTGGDMGAHVWFPAYLRDHLLPKGRLAGWSPDWYAGFPAGQFYFPLPALLIVVLDWFIPYNVAFKLVTALGPVALPAGAYCFGRGLRAPRPAPALLALGATGFLFFKGQNSTDASAARVYGNLHIMGGNLASNAAGEYSFTIALALALFFFGALAWALEHRRRLWLPAVLFAAVVMCHIVVALFAAAGAVIVWLVCRPRRTFGPAVSIGVVGVLLTGVWTFPLLATRGYQTDMAYEPVEKFNSFNDYLFPHILWWLLPFVVAAIAGGIIAKRRFTLALVALAVVSGIGFRLWETFTVSPVWDLRLLPFWYVTVFLLAGLGAAELVRGAAWLATRPRTEPWWEPLSEMPDDGDEGERAPVEPNGPPTPGAATDAPAPAGVETATEVAATPAPPYLRAVVIATLVALLATLSVWRLYADEGFLPFWASWNYSGYENVSGAAAKSYPEYKRLVDTMDRLPPGRALWEPSAGIGAYGTPLALMLLPYWTHGRIASMEGLYFESSATTPYHFMTVSTLAQQPSDPQRGLPYRTIQSFSVGVRYLQNLGVRYYLAQSVEAKQFADQSPMLQPVATVPDLDRKAPSGWTVYRVRDSAVVSPLPYEPVVVPGVSAHDWQDEVGVPWWDAPTRSVPPDLTLLDRPLVADGPAGWARARPPGVARRDAPDPKLRSAGAIARKTEPEVTVSHTRTSDDSVSFDVSRPGVPVVVKTSYFPNWKATGARGPYRATPNLMVVVPTGRHVRLDYQMTATEKLGRFATGLGLVGVVALAAWPWWRRRRAERSSPEEKKSETGG